MTSTRATIRSAIIAGLSDRISGIPVVGPRAWPDAADRLPMVIVQSPPHERKAALVKGPPSYETRGIFPVTMRVAATSTSAADAALEDLIDQVQNALFAWLPLQDLIEQIATVETRTLITPEGSHHIGEAVMLLECEYPEFFAPAPGVPLTEFQGTVADQSGNTLQTFDVKL